MEPSNAPRFATVPVFKPTLPTAEKLLPFLKQIDANHWYTNQGPLVHLFERKLADHFGVSVDRVVTCANGTVGLTLALQALGLPPGCLCLMPSWTFVATPAAALQAGLQPFFADVDSQTWALDPQHVRQIVRTQRIGAVIPVAPFGAPLDLAAWESFQTETGIPVLVDAAAGFDTFAATKTTLPFVVSLHATKVFGIGEGAVVVSPHDDRARTVRAFSNFGFDGSREARLPGGNAKLSEYGAAVGLAGLEAWPSTRRRWQRLTSLFRTFLTERAEKMVSSPRFGEGWVSSYGLVRLAPLFEATEIERGLADSGVETRLWWGNGCHTHPAYRDCPRESLMQTEALTPSVLGLPFWLGCNTRILDSVFRTLDPILERKA